VNDGAPAAAGAGPAAAGGSAAAPAAGAASTSAAGSPAPAARGAPGAPSVGGRWLALDALRGLTIAAMILVNNPGAWGSRYQYTPLRHAEWHGCTFTDLVFPAFLFCAGAAIVPALGRKVAAGAPRGPLVAAIGRRVAALVLLGLLLSAFPLVTFAEDRALLAPLLDVRVPGVLQRIGVCYGLAALLVLFTSPRTQVHVLVACVLGHWLVSTLVPVPGVGMPDLDDPARTLQGWLDRAVFGAHVYRGGSYDPEGLLSTIPALATTLCGVVAGRVLAGAGGSEAKVAALLRLGAVWLLLGAVWSWFLPLNKPLWTGSYALWTAGVAASGLGLCVWLFEQRGLARLAHPLQVYGVNALLVFVGSGLLARTLGRLVEVPTGGGPLSAQAWFFQRVLLPAIGDPKLASLAFALLWVLGWYAVLAALYRRGIVWRV
jgi:predicted acyltransferase